MEKEIGGDDVANTFEDIYEASEFVNAEYRELLKRFELKPIQLIGKTDDDILQQFDETLQALDRMAEVILPDNLVNFYNDLFVEDDNEKTAETATETSEPETGTEVQEEELGEETDPDDRSQETIYNSEEEEVSDTEDTETIESEDEVGKDEGEPSGDDAKPARRRPPKRERTVRASAKSADREDKARKEPKSDSGRKTRNVYVEDTESKRSRGPIDEKRKQAIKDAKEKAAAQEVKEAPVEENPVVEASVEEKPKRTVAKTTEKPTQKSAGIFTLLDRKSVLAELKRIKPKKPTKNSAIEYIAFHNGEMLFYNQHQALQYKLPDDAMSMEFVTPAFYLKTALEAITTKDCTLTEESRNIQLTGGKTHIALSKLQDNYVASVYESLGIKRSLDQFQPVPEGFIEGIKYCGGIATKSSENLRMLHTVKVTGDTIYANSVYQSMRFKINAQPFDEFYILQSSIAAIVDFNPQSFFVNKRWLHLINTDDTVLSIRLILPQAGEMFTETDELFTKFEDGISFGSDLTTHDLKQLSKYATEGFIKVFIKPDGTTILNANGQVGRITISTVIIGDVPADGLSFNIDPAVLLLCLNTKGRIKILGNKLQVSNEQFDYITSLITDI
jgi:hypothetical protein